ncbi:MAG TPA: S9 family peptidase, partial [Terriglobia bacterium]|nr:S9 family peptidase [Terriglobia bacterium]
MTFKVKGLFCLWLAGMLLLTVGCGEKAQPPGKEGRLIPMQDFFRNPEKTGFKISPNGEYLSFLMPWKHRLNIFVQKIGEEQVTRITESTQRDITDYLWANDQRLIYLMDRNGDENYRAYGVDRDGSGFKDLTPFENVRVSIIDDREDIKEELLIGMNKRDPKLFDAYRLNIYTGDLKLVGENPGNISAWMTDNVGQLRVAETTDGVNQTLLYRKTEPDPFRAIVTTNFKDTLDPLFFTFDDQNLYVSSNLGQDKQEIYRYDIDKGKFLERIYGNPDVDVNLLLRSKARKIITGVSFFTDKRHYYFFDEARRHLQNTLEQQLPGYEVVAGDGRNLHSKDETKLIVRTYSDKSLGAYYLYDQTTGKLQKLAEVSPWLHEAELADMQPIHYQSRDGLTIHGYLTLPRGIAPQKLPVVINPHGGPWARDHWGFDPEVQFLANRGIAVLQMNFRGSTGY